jgi:nucleoside-diphosphate-sugar epimerase
MQLKSSILNKKKIIVTGAAGFVGRNIVQKLLKENYYIISVDLNDPKIKSKKHKYYKSSIKSFFLKKKIKNLYAIIHLASDPRNNYYYLKPELALENISNTFSILNYIKNLKKKPILIFSSTKQIELDTLAKDKDMGPYSISKKSSEEFINFFSQNYGFRSYIIRFTEVFSMHDNPKNKALIKFISKNKTNENISIDNVNHNFEYISIEVICDGIIKILKNKIKHKYINFYGNKINILSLLMKIKRILNSDSKIIIKKLIKRKSDLKKSKTLNYKVNKNDLFYSKLRLIIGNEIKNK